MTEIKISYKPVLLTLMDYADGKGTPVPIDKKIEMLQAYLRFLIRNKPMKEEQMQEYERLIKDYETELNALNNEVKKGELNKERREYHSDNFWDTAFDIYYSDQSTTWPQVYKKMSVRMEELGLEMTMTKESFKTQRKREQKKRNAG